MCSDLLLLKCIDSARTRNSHRHSPTRVTQDIIRSMEATAKLIDTLWHFVDELKLPEFDPANAPTDADADRLQEEEESEEEEEEGPAEAEEGSGSGGRGGSGSGG